MIFFNYACSPTSSLTGAVGFKISTSASVATKPYPMAIIRSGWVLRPRTVMELRPLTSQQSLVAISWLSAQPMHAVEHLTS